jgi:uncharacterized protein YbjT (DUF2867 family)
VGEKEMGIRALITGATGMVGRGVLIECLESEEVEKVLVVGRRSCGVQHAKLTEILHDDFLDYSRIEHSFADCNACFFCLGVKSSGMTEGDYHRITHDYAVRLAEALLRRRKEMTFCFLSGAGTDQSLKSAMMWARVKGKAENSLKSLPFKSVYFFRPAYIQPMKEVKASYALYRFSSFLYPLLKLAMPGYVCTSEEFGRAMIAAAVGGADKQILESRDIVRLAKGRD